MDRLKKYCLFLVLIGLSFSCAAHKETAVDQHIPPPQSDSHLKYPRSVSQNQRHQIVQHAVKNLGLPYKWGGQSPKTGFDCSGLIVYAYKMENITLPRTAKAQFKHGKAVGIKELQAADIVFFKNPKANKVFHAGIYISDGVFIHAPGKGRHVTYGRLANPYFKKHYMGSRRYL